MYYRLNSYYALLKSLPGGTKNILHWHLMIGGEEVFFPEKENELKKVPVIGRFGTLKVCWNLLRMIFFHGPIYKNLCQKISKQNKKYLLEIESTNGLADQARLLFLALNSFQGFGLTVINDYLIMIALKLIKNFLSQRGFAEEYLGQIITTKGNLESVRPLEKIRELCALLQKKENILKIYQENLDKDQDQTEEFYPKLFKILKDQGDEDIAIKIKEYLDLYGERSFDELKIECPTFKQSPALFLDLLKWNMGLKGHQKLKGDTHKTFPFHHLGFIERRVLKIYQSFALRTIAMREETRLLRGQSFNLVRTGLSCLYKEYKKQTYFDKSIQHEDFYHLSMESLRDFGQNKITFQDCLSLIKKEKEFFMTCQKIDHYPEQCSFTAEEKKQTLFDDYKKCQDEGDGAFLSSKENFLQGVGASEGTVVGRPLILDHPKEALKFGDLSSYILVTKNTDPAWVFIMGQCKGLISEKGGLLGHTSIIGREFGLPTVIGVSDAKERLKNIEMIEINGKTGEIKFL